MEEVVARARQALLLVLGATGFIMVLVGLFTSNGLAIFLGVFFLVMFVMGDDLIAFKLGKYLSMGARPSRRPASRPTSRRRR